MAATLGTMHSHGRILLRGWWWPVGPNLVVDQMSAPVAGMMDGSLYAFWILLVPCFPFGWCVCPRNIQYSVVVITCWNLYLIMAPMRPKHSVHICENVVCVALYIAGHENVEFTSICLYLTGNTLRLDYKAQPVNAVTVYCENHTEHTNTLPNNI
jgi:hypothetical protein